MTRTAVASAALLLTLLSSVFQGATSAWAPTCKLYPQTVLPPHHSSPVLSSIAISDAFDVASIGIDNLSLASPKVGALKITLTAADANIGADANAILKDTITLKDVNEGGDATALVSVTFDDNIMVPFPDSPTNATTSAITGSFFPSQDLQTIALGNGTNASAGGSDGTWTLRIVDLGQNGTQHMISLTSWTLVLCPVVPAVAADQGSNASSAGAAGASNAITTNAEVKAANSSETGKLLVTLLDHMNRANSSLSTRLNGTPRAWSTLANASSGSTASEGLLGNQTIVEHIRSRLDELLASDTPAAASNASSAALLGSPAASDSTSLLGSFVLGNSTLLPGEPTSKLLLALRNMINDVANTTNTNTSNSSTTNSSFRSAPNVVAQSGPLGGSLGEGNLLDHLSSATINSDGSTILSKVSKLLTGTQYLNTVATIASGLQDAIQNIPIVKTIQGAASKLTNRVAGAQANVVDHVKAAQGYASSQIQDRVAFLQSQQDMIHSTIKQRIDNYNQALTSISSLISQAINKHSNAMISHSKDIQAVTRSVRDQVSQQASTTAKTVLGHLDTILKSTSGIGTVAKGLQSDFTAAANQLVEVYKTHLQAASNIMAASANAGLSRAQHTAESAIDQLDSVLVKANAALDKLSTGAVPLVGHTLGEYQQGLQFIEAALQSLKSKISAVTPDVGFGQLASGLSQGGVLSGALAQQLQTLTSTLGIGSRSSKALSLLGNIDGFSGKLAQLFPSTSG